VLYRVHIGTWNKPLIIKKHYVPKWDDRLTENVLSLYSTGITTEIHTMFKEVQKQSKELFTDFCWINGDTNPTNWGVRKDGTLVLYDWERIGYSHPAIDLVITIPGIGTADNTIESLVATRYLNIWNKSSSYIPFSKSNLIKHIKLAKIWSVIEFLANNSKTLECEVLNITLEIIMAMVEEVYLTYDA
jgi:thiamine kinase-like enzyme